MEAYRQPQEWTQTWAAEDIDPDMPELTQSRGRKRGSDTGDDERE